MSDQTEPKTGGTPADKPYEKPALFRVNLRPEEAVLGHCKISSSAGAAGPSCGLGPCRVPGS